MFDRALPSFSQILGGLLRKSRLREVIGHQLGLHFDRLGKSLHQGVSNPTVKLLALAPHHSGIGRILNQRMFEEVGRIRWFAAGEDQLAGGNVRERGLQRGSGGRGDRGEQTVGEFATYSSANLRDLLAWAKPIKARGQRPQQRSRNSERR